MSVLPCKICGSIPSLFPSESLPLTAEDNTLFLGDEVTIKENQIVRIACPNSGAFLVQREGLVWRRRRLFPAKMAFIKKKEVSEFQ